jgi:tRNA G10  N-methylase Trm11
MDTSYVFVFGRTPMLACSELLSVYPGVHVAYIHPHAVRVTGLPESAAEAMERLGGTVKIGREIVLEEDVAPSTLAKCIYTVAGEKPVTFAISQIEEPVSRSFLSSVKNELEALGGKSVRFMESRHGGGLSGAQEKEKGLIELLSIPTDGKTVISVIEATQDIDIWSKKDYERPFADPKKGMLPPKVARMVVNLAIGRDTQGKTLLDPFCGMGTILAESYCLGITAYGSDKDPRVAFKAQKNMEWVANTFPSGTPTPKIVEADAVHVTSVYAKESIAAIVTEPFLGNPSFGIRTEVRAEEIKNTVKGLEKLYIGCLKEWHSLLKPQGVVVMALPAFIHQGRKHFVKRVVDSCENFGYSMSQGPYEYARPQAVVQREFYVFTKKG